MPLTLRKQEYLKHSFTCQCLQGVTLGKVRAQGRFLQDAELLDLLGDQLPYLGQHSFYGQVELPLCRSDQALIEREVLRSTLTSTA